MMNFPGASPTQDTPGPISLQEIDEQISQHQAIIDQLMQIREMLMGGALQRAGGQFPGGQPPGNLPPIQPNPQTYGRF